MVRKLVNTLLATAVCAAIVGGGTTVTALAEGVARACSHEHYTLEDSGRSYKDLDSNEHTVYYWEEIYCWDCGGYITRSDSYEEGHTYNGGSVCTDCGHDSNKN